MSRRRKYLVCYDIADPKRLHKVAKICESYGTRVQLSVFEASLDGMMLASFQAELQAIIHHEEDQIIFIDLGRDDHSTPFHIDTMGLPYIKRSRITII